MLLFNELIFDDLIRGTTEIVTSSKFNALLGRADELAFEFVISEGSGTSPTLLAKYRHSCSNDGTFTAASTLINGESISNLPYQKVATQTGPLAAYGQLSLKLDGTGTVTARMRVWASGRASGRG